ncbi:MAG: ATP-binding protein [Phycisphaeraceae bacterium]|nr:ATP-binding protein [Phycisphaeraceae bacterium]
MTTTSSDVSLCPPSAIRNTTEHLCERIAQRLSSAIGQRRYSMWFDRTARIGLSDDEHRLEVAVPNKFVADWIGRNFEGDLRHAAHQELGRDIDVRIEVMPALFADFRQPAAATPPDTAALTEITQPTRVRPPFTTAAPLPTPNAAFRHRLETFIVGPSNELAFAAAQRLLDDDHSSHPLFLHGGCGLGKTHLLQGVCCRLLDRNPQAKVLYTTGEQFTNEFLAAMRANKLEAFRRKIRQLDLLAVDDVHFLANKAATQQEFLHSFDAIEMGGARVMLASDSHPKLIRQFSDALVNRCVRGMVVEIKPPDTTTRARIVRALVQRRGLCLLETVIDVLASRCVGSVREIEGTLAKLHALASLAQQREGGVAEPIGHTIVNHLFDADLQTPRRIIRFDNVLGVVAQETGVSKAQILANGRQASAVLARSLVIYLTRQMTTMSYPEIASAMGRKNHSTVITAAQRVEKQVSEGVRVTVPATMEQAELSDLVQRLRHAVMRA